MVATFAALPCCPRYEMCEMRIRLSAWEPLLGTVTGMSDYLRKMLEGTETAEYAEQVAKVAAEQEPWLADREPSADVDVPDELRAALTDTLAGRNVSERTTS